MYNAKGKLRQSDMIEQHLPLVRKEALMLKLRLPAHVELDDLIQSGTLGLLDAVKRYKPVDGVKFEVFARQRIRGSIFDELRSNDWVPRRVRKAAKEIEAAISSLNLTLGRAPLDSEIANALNLDMSSYGKLLMDSNTSILVSFDDMGLDKVEEVSSGHFSSPLNELMDSSERGRVADAIRALPEREQQTLHLYYKEEMNLKEIGAVFGVSEGRVSQIHSQALSRLRVTLAESQ